jgi:asparagine synthase (glutamine-hydrolysing)
VSGIAGIVRFDGRPVERDELQALAARLGLPGGAAAELRLRGCAGFALAALDVDGLGAQTLAPAANPGPFVLCDARIDARGELATRLRAAGGAACSGQSGDDALIAAAWNAWGARCARELLGDFAFALWDPSRGSLFCARDPFGVKPFYYACREGRLIFSNALECVRSHPSVSDELDDLAILDFLLVGHGLQQDATAYRDIARLAPGHALSWDAQRGLRIERWFDLPLEEPYRGRDLDDLLDEFRTLLRLAVKDRLRGARAAVSMSGGLDSTSVAAAAREVLAAGGGPCELRAFTAVSPRLLAADDEDRYARLAADYLGIPLTVLRTEMQFSAPFAANARNAPEPVDASAFDLLSGCGAAGEGRPQPVLTGQGGDVGFFHEWDYATGYLRAGRWLALAQDAATHLRLHGRMPPLYLRTRLRRALGKARDPAPAFPPWLRPELIERHALRERFEAAHREPPRSGAARTGAHHRATLPMWKVLFEQFDPAVTGLPFEFRHPYFDLRLLRFLLRLPELPWCVDKTLLRLALRGTLPEAVRTRPKAPLPGFPEYEALRGRGIPGADRLFAVHGLQRFVDVERLRQLAGRYARLRPSEIELLLRPLGLAAWLSRCDNSAAA